MRSEAELSWEERHGRAIGYGAHPDRKGVLGSLLAAVAFVAIVLLALVGLAS